MHQYKVENFHFKFNNFISVDNEKSKIINNYFQSFEIINKTESLRLSYIPFHEKKKTIKFNVMTFAETAIYMHIHDVKLRRCLLVTVASGQL